MGRSTCYVVAKEDDYIQMKEAAGHDWEGIQVRVDPDELYDHLNSAVGGLEALDDLTDGCDALDCSDEGEWYSRGKGMLVMDIVDDDRTWLLRWHSPEAKVDWFRPYYDKFREDADHYLNHNFGPEDFAKWESLNPPWRLEKSYERQFDGQVVILDGRGYIQGVYYPMEFLRMVQPGEEWALSKIGWLYK